LGKEALRRGQTMVASTMADPSESHRPVPRSIESAAPFVRYGPLLFVSALVGNVGSFALYFVGIRHLDIAAYGDLYALITATALFSAVTASATVAIAKTCAELLGRGDLAGFAAFGKWVRDRAFLFAAIELVLASAASAQAARYLHLIGPGEVVAWGFVTAVSIVVPIYRGILQGAQAFVSLAVSYIVEGLLRASFGIAAILLGYGVAGALYGQGIGVLVCLWYVTAAAAPKLRPGDVGAFRPSSRFFRSISAAGGAVIAITALASMDVLFAKHYLEPGRAGLYGIVALVGRIIFFLAAFVPIIAIPKVASQTAQRKPTYGVILLSVGITAAIAAMGLALTTADPTLLVSVLAGGAYPGAAAYVVSYGVAATFLALANVTVGCQLAAHRFSFLVPLAAVVGLEALALVRWHDSIRQLITVAIAANAAAFFASCLGMWSSPRSDG
jgi:O-antigen/teichoic acid export membrane protein